jgi:hypothetical protein
VVRLALAVPTFPNVSSRSSSYRPTLVSKIIDHRPTQITLVAFWSRKSIADVIHGPGNGVLLRRTIKAPPDGVHARSANGKWPERKTAGRRASRGLHGRDSACERPYSPLASSASWVYVRLEVGRFLLGGRSLRFSLMRSLVLSGYLNLLS